jgi:hypothetical protein
MVASFGSTLPKYITQSVYIQLLSGRQSVHIITHTSPLRIFGDVVRINLGKMQIITLTIFTLYLFVGLHVLNSNH